MTDQPRPASRQESAVRIDAHHHLWDLTVRDQPWTAGLPALRRTFTIDQLRPALVTGRIDATIVVQTICVAPETPELIALAAQDPLVRGVVGWVDLTARDVADRLQALRALPGGQALVGIRHQVQLERDPYWLSRPDVRRGLGAVADAGLVFDLIVTQTQLPAAVHTARALPDLRFVLDHGGKPPIAAGTLEPWRTHLAELASLPNVGVKLSGLVTEADPASCTLEQLRPYADTIISEFGAARVMFGSDWPVCTLAASYAQVLSSTEALTASLSAAERDAVFGTTAARWYRISP